MERKINEPFKDQSGKMVKAVLSNPTGSCCGCCYREFGTQYCFNKVVGNCCTPDSRSDNQDVIFKEETE